MLNVTAVELVSLSPHGGREEVERKMATLKRNTITLE
jgi:hypothetical protein